MATKSIKALRAYNPEDVIGVAIFTDSQISNLQFERIPSLNPESIYVIPKQWIHSERLLRPINGYDKSNKVYVLEINEGNIVRIFCMGLSGLRTTFFTKVEDGVDFKVEAYKDPTSKLFRGSQRAEETVFGTTQELPTRISGSKAYIPRDFAFRFTQKILVYQPEFMQVAKKWDMAHYTDGDKDYLQLRKSRVNEYRSDVNVPAYDLSQLLDDDRANITKMQESIPA